MELKRRVYSTLSALGPTIGDDVRIFKHGLHRYEDNFFPPPPYDRTYGALMDDAVRTLQDLEGLTQRHYIGQETFDVIWANLDPYRKLLYRRFKVPVPKPPPVPTLVSPLPIGVGYVCQGLHWTAGLPGNAAFDFCAPPRTPILAVCDARVLYVSGHDPDDDTWDDQGVFGWSIHYEDAARYRYYLTHLGDPRPNFVEGEIIRAGQILGRVGDQDFRPDHLHQGVSSPFGVADAVARITAIAHAAKVAPGV